MTEIPDFGTVERKHNGITLLAQAIVPGMALPDLVKIYEKAFRDTPKSNFFLSSANQPVAHGVKAVVLAVLKAVYSSDKRPS